jgi:septal ring factor EnvC (AmiA/AmiB activator)
MRSHKRNDITIFTETIKTLSPEFSGGWEGRGTNLDEVAWLIANLKETITQQNNIIQSVKADLTEIKSEQESLKNQNVEFQEEI